MASPSPLSSLRDPVLGRHKCLAMVPIIGNVLNTAWLGQWGRLKTGKELRWRRIRTRTRVASKVVNAKVASRVVAVDCAPTGRTRIRTAAVVNRTISRTIRRTINAKSAFPNPWAKSRGLFVRTDLMVGAHLFHRAQLPPLPLAFGSKFSPPNRMNFSACSGSAKP